MIYEFCAENTTLLEKAMQAGARRIELCDNLAVGGTTPSFGTVRAAVELGRRYDTSIMTMIRPRGGDFVYADLEIEIMLADIKKAKEAGSQGVVFGALNEAKELDIPKMKRLLDASRGMEVVFHMAFDVLARYSQPAAMDWLIEHGVGRILTHGGPAGQPIEEHVDWLDELLEHAA
ncbi:copper homeostasis protein CutC, partial [Streptococcus sp. DD11]